MTEPASPIDLADFAPTTRMSMGLFITVRKIRCYMRDPDGYLIEVGSPPACSMGSTPRSARRIYPAESPWPHGRG